MAMSTMSGERSRPPVFHGGNMRRTGSSTGSVTRRRNITTGFRGSGLTQLISAAAMMTHEYRPSSQPMNSTREEPSTLFPLSELARAQGGALHRVDERAPHATLLEG